MQSEDAGWGGWVGGMGGGPGVALPHVEVDLAPAATQLLLKPRHQREHQVLLHQPVRRKPCRMAAAV